MGPQAGLLGELPINYHEVAKVADEIEAVEKEIRENHIEVAIMVAQTHTTVT